MQTKALLELLDEAGHVAELARLLAGFSKRRTAHVGQIELLELAKRSAGATYRYPSPEPALQVAFAIGLVRRTGNVISLTDTGALFVRLQGNRRFELSSEQCS